METCRQIDRQGGRQIDRQGGSQMYARTPVHVTTAQFVNGSTHPQVALLLARGGLSGSSWSAAGRAVALSAVHRPGRKACRQGGGQRSRRQEGREAARSMQLNAGS